LLILKVTGIKKGSGVPHTDKVGKITRAQLNIGFNFFSHFSFLEGFSSFWVQALC
jgi:hypothetical protein